MKKAMALALCMLLFAVCAFGCAPKVADIETKAPSENDAFTEFISEDGAFSERDLDGSWDDASSTHITLGDRIEIDGAGADATGGVLYIRSGGTYVLSGSMQGQIVVEASKTDKLQLVMNGASVSCADGPALYIKKADKVFLTLAEGTQNSLSDSTAYKEGDEEQPDGAIYSKDDLSINGAGALSVSGNYKHGVVSKDDLVVTHASLTVTSVCDALRGKDCVKIKDASLTLNAGDDGIRSTNTESAMTGNILLSGGTYRITAACDGVQAASDISITDGTFTVQTGGGSANASFSETDMPQGAWGSWGTQTDEKADTPSAKGFKAGASLTVAGGAFTLDTSDDALHANKNVTLAPVSMLFSAGDDAIHAGGNLVIEGGTITIEKSYEGLEGNTVTVKGGVINVTAFDDGVNAAGGADGSSLSGRPGMNEFAADESCFIRIEGGTLHVNASGDGMDSNGDLYISGGETTVSGPVNDGNGTLDYNGKAEISGGVFMGAGSKGMAQGFSDSSAQCSLIVSYTKAQAANTSVFLRDANGNVLAGFAPEKEYSLVVISAPGMVKDGVYTLYADEGKLCEITLKGVSSCVNEKGESTELGAMGAPMGGMPMGGQKPQDGKMNGERPTGTPNPEAAQGEAPTGTPPAGSPPEGGPGGGTGGGPVGPGGEPPTGTPAAGSPTAGSPTA